MNLEHWQLDRSPFRTTINPERCYPSEALNEATARVEHLVEERRRVGVLLGERGLGKTATLAAIQHKLLGEGVVVGAVDAFGLSRRELLWRAAEEIDAGPDPTDDEARLWRKLSDRARQNKWQQRDTLLLVAGTCSARSRSRKQRNKPATSTGRDYTILAATAIAAVSIRRIRGPNEAVFQPASSARLTSSSVKPPSGPIAHQTGRADGSPGKLSPAG